MADTLTVRISGGHLRGRKRVLNNAPGLRPTPSRVRETLFNWLQGWLEDQRVLDMYAGAGSLSLEALSRGAGEVIAIERDPALARSLAQTAKDWGDLPLRCITGDALSTQVTGPFDLVFIDPPFGKGLLAPSLERARAVLGPDAMVAAEFEKGLSVPEGWRTLKHTQAGQDQLALIEPE